MTIENGSPAGRPLHAQARHWGGFLSSGVAAFAVDAAVLEFATRVLGLGPLVGRVIAISCAMVVAWLMHRRLTFAVAHAPSLREFAKFAAVAWMSSAINYGIYAAILLARPMTEPLIALIIASVIAMCTSYVGMRFGVFRRSS
jgi:putative flippase GtrA